MSDITTFGETVVHFFPNQGKRWETAETLNFRTMGRKNNVATVASRLGAGTT
jgi:2-dehydro-3-deoxygluconokinase